MNKQKYYKKWRTKTYGLLRKKGVKIQQKSVHKLQQKIYRGIKALNERRNQVITWTFKDVSNVVVSAIGLACIYCRTIITWKTWSLDHKVPVARGGDNSKENIQITCKKCNRRKGSLSHEAMEYLMIFLLDHFHKKFPEHIAEVMGRISYGGKFHSIKK